MKPQAFVLVLSALSSATATAQTVGDRYGYDRGGYGANQGEVAGGRTLTWANKINYTAPQPVYDNRYLQGANLAPQYAQPPRGYSYAPYSQGPVVQTPQYRAPQPVAQQDQGYNGSYAAPAYRAPQPAYDPRMVPGAYPASQPAQPPQGYGPASYAPAPYSQGQVAQTPQYRAPQPVAQQDQGYARQNPALAYRAPPPAQYYGQSRENLAYLPGGTPNGQVKGQQVYGITGSRPSAIMPVPASVQSSRQTTSPPPALPRNTQAQTSNPVQAERPSGFRLPFAKRKPEVRPPAAAPAAMAAAPPVDRSQVRYYSLHRPYRLAPDTIPMPSSNSGMVLIGPADGPTIASSRRDEDAQDERPS